MKIMRKPALILFIALFFSCTAKKDSGENVTVAPVEEETQQPKKFVYVDTAADEQVVQSPVYDSATQIVQAPAEEAVTGSNTETNDTIEIDTSVYRWSLTVAKDSVEEWKNMKQFAYVKKLDSLLKAEKEKKKLEEKPREYDNSPSWLDNILASKGLQVFLWILAGGFILFVVFKLFVTGGAFRRSTTKVTGTMAEAEEEIITAESDFERMIREAVQQKNYRLATRYHYLQTLHLLADKQYVQLAADKTNYSYVREIKDYNKQNEFAGLTLNYEYVWYGEFDIDELLYQKIKTGFQSFNSKI